jgi:primosomal protein N' (replication factor Y)
VFASVAVPVPLGRAFSYAVPEALQSQVTAGMRVLCEFGHRKVLGVVLEISEEGPVDVDSSRVKPLLAVLDSEPALPAELLRFLRELADYYLAPIGEVLRLALPTVERSQLQTASSKQLFDETGLASVGRLIQIAKVVPAAASAEAASKPRGQALQIMAVLEAAGELPVAELEKRFSNARAAVRRLVEVGSIVLEKRIQQVDPFWTEPAPRDRAKRLNVHQDEAVKQLVEAIRAKRPRGFLLEGVTGSGKTEVYLQTVEACLAVDGGVIVLVPEIALTPQLVARFRSRFGDEIAVLHSGLSDGERTRMWRRLRDGQVRIAVGARSALFAPVRELRLVCVDEEHDGSFKQEEGVRYHARDMALLRAHRASAVCVLGSATPSLASEALVRSDRLTRLHLPERAVEGAQLPEVEIVNLRNVGPGPSGNRLLSLPLHRELERVLGDGKQAILFLNRRGFAPSLICESCGTVVECPNCSVALTLHRADGEALRCHYCDYSRPGVDSCASCNSRRFAQEGVGTERIEHVLKDAFPTARVARLDRDVAAGLKSEQLLSKMRDGELDILVGTQMVTKGHDLPNVALVGVLNSDAALSLPDYQASERTFSLLVQVAGRAGRSGARGKVVIQTRNPEHPAVRFAKAHDTRSFIDQELAERKEAHYPPFFRLLMVRVDSPVAALAEREAARLAQLARAVSGDDAEVLGPSAAPLARLKNRFRYRCILRAAKRAPLYRAANAILQAKVDRRVRVTVDIDPVSML